MAKICRPSRGARRWLQQNWTFTSSSGSALVLVMAILMWTISSSANSTVAETVPGEGSNMSDMGQSVN